MEKTHIFFETEYTEEKMDALAEKLLAPYGGAAGLAAGKNVLIKPNLVSKKPLSTGTTTHPLMLRALCKAFIAGGARVCVAESHGGAYTDAAVKAHFAGCGVTEALKGLDATICTEAESVPWRAENGVLCKSFEVIKPVAQADLIVNLCKLKTHALTTYSGAAKNTFGVVPGFRKFELHARFPDIRDFAVMLNDLHLSLPVGLNIVDGILGMEGNGPTSGLPRRFGFVAVSKSAFVCDLVCADLLGIAPSRAPQLADAVKRGLCPAEADYSLTNLTEERYKATRITDLVLPDSTPRGAVSAIDKLQRLGGGRFLKLIQPKPRVNKKRCVGCGKCAEYCPAKTIEMRQGRPVIKRDGCIRCFCCQELCPIGAMAVKTSRVFKL